MRCFFCRRTDDIVHIGEVRIYNNDIYICDDCKLERQKLNMKIQSQEEITYDIYKLAMQYEVDCPMPNNISMLDMFYAMAQ